MKPLKKEFRIGLLCFVLYMILYRFTNVHHIVLGVIFGISIGAYIIGLLPDATKRKMKAFKLSLVGRKS
jgi:multisubunit Na+/H+ antiporter MnhE subunit